MELNEKDEIRNRIDLIEFISRYTALKRSGRTYKGLCPFHSERTPSFHVDPEKGFWRCFGQCGVGGDLFAFAMKAENLTFPEATERLAALAGVTLTRRGIDSTEAARQRDEKERLYDANAEAARFFKAMLAKAALAQAYVRERGLIHETLENFSIGFAPAEWGALARFLSGRGLSMEDAERAGLVYPSKRDGEFTDKFRGRLIFPIYDVQERVVAFGGRTIPNPELPEGTNQGPKYLNSPETPIFSKGRILYGLNRARKAIADANRVLVVEGYMDVIAAHQAGIENVVATLGTSLTDDHIKILGRYTKNILLSFDSDEAGIRAALRAAELVQSHGPEYLLRVLAMPSGDDPDSMLRRGDIAGFRRTMDSAFSLPEFRIKVLESHSDLRSDQGKLAFLQEVIPILAEVRSSLELDLLVRRLAPYHPAFGSGTRAEASILQEIQQRRSARGAGAPQPASDDYLTASAPRRPSPEPGQRRYPSRYPSYQERYPAPRPETPLTAPHAVAAERAERTVLQALLADDWRSVALKALQQAAHVLGRTPGTLFSSSVAQRLVEALFPLLQGRVPLQRALDQLTDQELVFFAGQFLVLMPTDPPLSEEAIQDCVKELALRHPPLAIHQIQEKLQQGLPLSAQELTELQVWMRAKKRGASEST